MKYTISYEKNGVHIVGVGTIPDSRLRRMTQGAKRVYETALALDCDIYHFHDPELLPYGLMLKKKGKKVIFDILILKSARCDTFFPIPQEEPITKTTSWVPSFINDVSS